MANKKPTCHYWSRAHNKPIRAFEINAYKRQFSIHARGTV